MVSSSQKRNSTITCSGPGELCLQLLDGANDQNCQRWKPSDPKLGRAQLKKESYLPIWVHGCSASFLPRSGSLFWDVPSAVRLTIGR